MKTQDLKAVEQEVQDLLYQYVILLCETNLYSFRDL